MATKGTRIAKTHLFLVPLCGQFLLPNTDVIENACENNLDLLHLGGKFSK